MCNNTERTYEELKGLVVDKSYTYSELDVTEIDCSYGDEGRLIIETEDNYFFLEDFHKKVYRGDLLVFYGMDRIDLSNMKEVEVLFTEEEYEELKETILENMDK